MHNEAFEVAETRINTECFLPIREGVSKRTSSEPDYIKFPPYTGGCIEKEIPDGKAEKVSSLYGRVYRYKQYSIKIRIGFLPIREGVSLWCLLYLGKSTFPPYTGGCIKLTGEGFFDRYVSSLYGRVYRHGR